MSKDPVCGMEVPRDKGFRLTHEGETYYFCSKHCLEKFVKEHGIFSAHIATCNVQPAPRFYKNKTFIVSSVLSVLIILSYVFPVLEPFRKSFFDYTKIIWWAVILGFFLGGLIDYYIPREYVSSILAQKSGRVIINSVILGFFMSACSHGILALSIQLHKKGASTPSVVAFLLASPWANITLTVMLIGFFGLKGLFIIVSALVIALNTGFIFQFLERKGLIEKNAKSLSVDKEFSIRKDMEKRFKEYKFSFQNLKADIKGIYGGSVSLGNMVFWWILIGMGLASLASAYIPAEIFRDYMGPAVSGLFVTLFIATIIEVCSEGSAPMSFEIFKQTGALGNSFVFLMAGVATDYTEIGLLWHNVGKKTAIWLPVITVPQIILLGFLANMIFK